MEVKTGSVPATALRGLLEFTRRFPEYRPLLVGDPGVDVTAERAGITAMTWRDFLLTGPPSGPGPGDP